jgi:hypothetical protein
MRGIWYGDRRDRVKWGALLHLADTRAISCIVQVAYFRHSPGPMLQTQEGEVSLSVAVWKHFSDLAYIKRLGEATGKNIVVLDQPFDPARRREYVATVVAELREVERPMIVFLDPDTGIEPARAEPEHVTRQDIGEIWAALLPGDILAVYQHADRTTTWRDDRGQKMAAACDNTPVQAILGTGVASDVAMLWCRKGSPG